MYLPPFDIHILGTSSAIPTSHHFPSAQFVHINGSYLLIDCGEGTQIQLKKYKLPSVRLDYILISHLHGDHIFGLPGLLTSLSLLQRKKELTLIAPKELKQILDTIFKYAEAKITYPLKFIFTTHTHTELLLETEKFKIYIIPLKHRIPTTGFVIEEQPRHRKIIKEKITLYKIPIHQFNRLKKGYDAEDENGHIIKNELVTQDPPPPRKYVYLSDTAYMEHLPDICAYPDVLYHEATFLDAHTELARITQHSTTVQAAHTARNINAKKLLIGHYSSRYQQIEPFLNEAKKIFENTELALEGKKITL